MIQLTTIGIVESDFDKSTDHEVMREHESTIRVKPEYAEGLYRLEESEYIQVIFGFDRSEGFTLKGPRRHGHVLGVFASRSPRRPSSLGVTVVRLLERDGTTLRVMGLDALNGTPVLDIKPHVPRMDHPERAARGEELRTHPRARINRLARDGDWETLLLKAGELHGHFCPFLALGVRAAGHALRELGLDSSEGMEDTMAIVETNSCFSDGVQYVTGCTFGNNALVYRDYGKTAFTLAVRGGSALRIVVRQGTGVINEHSPGAAKLFEKVVTRRKGSPDEEQHLKELWAELAFELVKRPVAELFDVQREAQVDLPGYAPIHESEVCDSCREQVMASRVVRRHDETLCIPCAHADFLQLDGRGLEAVHKS